LNYVIVGNGVAGTTAASAIRKHDPDGNITILSEEALPCYSRIRLIEYLAEEASEKDIILYKDEWYAKNSIRLLLNSRVISVDKEKRAVFTAHGESLPYDKLLLATGGVSFVPPIQGAGKQGVFTLRTVQDADEIIRYSKNRKNVLLIGGGLLGLEAGNSLRKTGHNITVVEFFPRLLPRQMDPAGAEILKARMERMGFTFYLGARSREIIGDSAVRGVLLEDGTMIECDVILVSAGVRPRMDIARQLGLTINKGLVVNERLETGTTGIYAAGDVIEFRDQFYGIWPAAQKQGKIAGINMAGGDALYEGTTMSNVLKVVGIDLAAAGDIDADGKFESILQKNEEKYVYRKLVIQDNTIIGCILSGDISGYQKILKAISERRDIESIREDLAHWNLETL
jgi:nitrite reductase (NADH) large subunit